MPRDDDGPARVAARGGLGGSSSGPQRNTGLPPELVRELARNDRWRDAVAALGLPEDQASALRVAVIRFRLFGAGGSPARRRQRGRR